MIKSYILAVFCGLLLFCSTAFCDETNVDNNAFEFTRNNYYMDGSYIHICFEITNISNDILYLDNPELQITDSEGNLLQVESSSVNVVPHIIAPGDMFYIYSVNGVKLRDAVLNDTFTVDPFCRVSIMSAMPHFFETNSRNLLWNEAGTEIYALGKFVNDTSEDVSGYMVAVITDEEDGRCVGIGRAYKQALSGEEVAFDFTVDEYLNLHDCSGTVGYNFFFDSLIYPE